MPITNVAAGLLGREERLLDAVGRGREHLFGPQLRDPDARSEPQWIGALGEMGVLQLLANPLGHGQRIVKRCLVQKQCECVAAESGDHVPAPGEFFNLGRCLPQDHVAALVAVFAVDQRERIQIDKNERRFGRLTGLPGGPLQLGDERPAIRQRRQQIGVRENCLHLDVLGLGDDPLFGFGHSLFDVGRGVENLGHGTCDAFGRVVLHQFQGCR